MRLTYRDSSVPHINKKNELWKAYSDRNYNEVINKLADYEDAEEQELYIWIPCKVGDTLYVPSQGSVLNGTVDRIVIGKNNKIFIFATNNSGADWVFYPDNFNKTVFLTYEEAKATIQK